MFDSSQQYKLNSRAACVLLLAGLGAGGSGFNPLGGQQECIRGKGKGKVTIRLTDMICCKGRIATVKRKAAYDTESLRCYRCHSSYDRAIALQEYGGVCPDCGQAMKPAISHYTQVCSRCDAELFGKLHH